LADIFPIDVDAREISLTRENSDWQLFIKLDDYFKTRASLDRGASDFPLSQRFDNDFSVPDELQLPADCIRGTYSGFDMWRAIFHALHGAARGLSA